MNGLMSITGVPLSASIGNIFIFCSFIISNTSWLEVQWKEGLEIADFNTEHVYFQKENSGTYIAALLN